jgi:hypothetical protein
MGGQTRDGSAGRGFLAIVVFIGLAVLVFKGCGTGSSSGAASKSTPTPPSAEVTPVATPFVCYFEAKAGGYSVSYRFKFPGPVLSKADDSTIGNCYQYDRVIAQSTLGKDVTFAGDQTNAPSSLANMAAACSNTADSGLVGEVLDDGSGTPATVCATLGWK